MFSDLIADLKIGVLSPDLPALKKRFNIALIKKMAVLKLPYHFWSSDSKINPSSEQLAWAAFILEDCEIFAQVKTVIALEVAEQLNAKSGSEVEAVIQDRLRKIADKFLSFAPNSDFRHVLTGKVCSSVYL